MTKAELVAEISAKTGIEKFVALQTVEAMMKIIKNSVSTDERVYLRGFGTFFPKKRAQKIGRFISNNHAIVIPEHFFPGFKPVKTFSGKLKMGVERNTVPEPCD